MEAGFSTMPLVEFRRRRPDGSERIRRLRTPVRDWFDIWSRAPVRWPGWYTLSGRFAATPSNPTENAAGEGIGTLALSPQQAAASAEMLAILDPPACVTVGARP